MNKYPISILAFLVFYILILYVGLNSLLLPVLEFGFLKYAVFWVVTILILLPAILFLLYFFYKKHETLIKYAIFVSVAAAAVIVFAFTVPVI